MQEWCSEFLSSTNNQSPARWFASPLFWKRGGSSITPFPFHKRELPHLNERGKANHPFSAKKDVEKRVLSIPYGLVLSRLWVLEVYVLGSWLNSASLLLDKEWVGEAGPPQPCKKRQHTLLSKCEQWRNTPNHCKEMSEFLLLNVTRMQDRSCLNKRKELRSSLC